MSDTWSDIQAFKSKQSSLREKLARRRKEREEVLAGTTTGVTVKSPIGSVSTSRLLTGGSQTLKVEDLKPAIAGDVAAASVKLELASVKLEPKVTFLAEASQVSGEELIEIEKSLLHIINDISLTLPCDVATIKKEVSRCMMKDISIVVIENLLQKFAAQTLISLRAFKDEMTVDWKACVIESVDLEKLAAVYELDMGHDESMPKKKKPKTENSDIAKKVLKQPRKPESAKQDDSVESLLSMQSAKERENKKLSEEILQLLSTPTAKEQSIVEKFKSQGGALQEFCPFGTKEECLKLRNQKMCGKLHFRKIIHKHTDENLGDCSFLNTCFHMDTCKYVHYEIDYPERQVKHLPKLENSASMTLHEGSTMLFPPQWVQCDLRKFDMSVLGKFSVIMADPPWDIHMELPYGTMSDDEMRALNVPVLQDDGYVFLWVTGRAMELGRECLRLWGYERVDELIWVKTNQLQRIIRTGRTGHWLNHGKEHCLVGAKGNPKHVNRGLDCDVIVAEVRATSHKPDEVYGIIERLSPGSRKVELFGRPHNVQRNWITLGNQVDGVKLLDPEVVRLFKTRYPDADCITGPIQ